MRPQDGHIALSLMPARRSSPTPSASRGSPTFTDADSFTRQDEIGDLDRGRAQDAARPPNGSATSSERKLWHAPVQDYAAIAQDPQVRHMQALVTVPGAGTEQAPITLVNHPLRYDGEAAEVRAAAAAARRADCGGSAELGYRG